MSFDCMMEANGRWGHFIAKWWCRFFCLAKKTHLSRYDFVMLSDSLSFFFFVYLILFFPFLHHIVFDCYQHCGDSVVFWCPIIIPSIQQKPPISFGNKLLLQVQHLKTCNRHLQHKSRNLKVLCLGLLPKKYQIYFLVRSWTICSLNILDMNDLKSPRQQYISWNLHSNGSLSWCRSNTGSLFLNSSMHPSLSCPEKHVNWCHRQGCSFHICHLSEMAT